MKKICIYGTGMFGFAMAKHFGDKFEHDNGYEIVSYDRSKEVVDHINHHRSHPYHFINAKISGKNVVTNDLAVFLKNVDILILCVPSQGVREVVRKIRKYIQKDIVIVNTAKALETRTGMRLSEVIAQELSGVKARCRIAQFSGGSIASDIVIGAPLGAEIACVDRRLCKALQRIFSDEKLRVYGNTDIVGVEYAGAFKNVIAILSGITHGLGLPYGSETHLISRAAREAKELAVKLGAKEHTFSVESQAWGNDLWMSCTGNTRNRYFGELIGKGIMPQNALQILNREHKITEGYHTVKIIPLLARSLRADPYILLQLYYIVYKNKQPIDAINDVMRRELEFLNPPK